ncbi:major facilitator superfamily domain-containing protein [Penicillium antarcticum]|uniref:major facilitator superfamily domain-containing protein n=1 Tax=Penicillium antarcticum TaxID=416450 RepID=UPI0023921240|nr:major facilitator superfamily domain-containing protein [Penicillium antarcticum]KAJ5318018.1 major facilitator superfamily domain-containing protein [Penicillium antarcticum]
MFVLMVSSLSLALFLTGIEATIVLSIFNSPLVVCGIIFGVKQTLLTCLFLFVAFSGGCAAAQNLSQLIICRTFQGLGGAGIYSLTFYSFVRIVPYEQYDKISSVAGGIMSLGLVLGPLFGGAIANSDNWLWVFLYNVPAGCIAAALLFFALPSQFPYQARASTDQPKSDGIGVKIKTSLHRLDLFGAFLIFTACSFIIAALQEGNLEYPWSSGMVISFFVISGIAWIAFVGWEWLISLKAPKISAILPWRLTSNRIFMGVALGMFTTGLPLTVCIILLPQRFQTVNGSSPIGAGVKLLSFALSCPVGIIGCSILAGRIKVPFFYISLFGIIFQIIGLFLYSSIDSIVQVWPGQFGYLALAGLGSGLTMGAFTMLGPLVVDKEDQSIALGIGLQLRMLGGVLGVAASTAILNHYLDSRLSSVLKPAELAALLRSTEAILTFDHDVQIHVREIYAMAYSAQITLAAAFSVSQLVALAMIWKRQNFRYSKE